MAIASAPGVAQLVDEVLEPAPSIGPRIVIVTPGPGRPDPARRTARTRRRSARSSSTDASPRSAFAVSVASSRSSVAISLRSWSLRALRLATRTVRSWRTAPARRGAAGLGAQLDDDEQAEHEGHGRDRQLVATACIAVSPPGSTAGPCRATARAPAARSAGDTVPAKAGMSTVSGSANETRMPYASARPGRSRRTPAPTRQPVVQVVGADRRSPGTAGRGTPS